MVVLTRIPGKLALLSHLFTVAILLESAHVTFTCDRSNVTLSEVFLGVSYSLLEEQVCCTRNIIFTICFTRFTSVSDIAFPKILLVSQKWYYEHEWLS